MYGNGMSTSYIVKATLDGYCGENEQTGYEYRHDV